MGFYRAILNGVLLGLLAYGCTTAMIAVKSHPDYTGVDPKAAPYVDEYLSLAKDRGITFKNVVTVGFKDIDNGDIVGMCNYGTNFREIDIDMSYWNRTTSIGHISLLFHELSHCYCDRDHDYGKGRPYGDAEKAKKDASKKGGFFSDGCPISLLFPQALDDSCTLSHYDEYVHEMFERCVKY